MTGCIGGENSTDWPGPPGNSVRYLETIVGELRTAVAELRQEVRAVSAIAAAAQNQVSAHAAVCDERQRQIEVRQAQRDSWHEDQARMAREFMAESASDRARLRAEIITASQVGRTELRDWSIRVLVWIAGVNVIGVGATLVTILKGWGH